MTTSKECCQCPCCVERRKKASLYHKEYGAERRKQWRKENAESVRESLRRWRSSDRGKKLMRESYLRNRETILARAKAKRTQRKENPNELRKLRTINAGC